MVAVIKPLLQISRLTEVLFDVKFPLGNNHTNRK